MKTYLIGVTALFLIVSMTSCDKIAGDGVAVIDSRNLIPFNGVRLILDCDVNFVLSDTATRVDPKTKKPYKKDSSLYRVIIKTENNIKGYIETPVINGRLVIKLRNDKILRSYDRIWVEVRAPDISYVEMTGPGSMNINLADTLNRPFLDCILSGNGSINFRHINYSYLKINLTGAGYAFCDSSGHVKTADLNSTSCGNINLFNIISDTVHATLTGSGDISVSVDSLMNGTISGSGNIWYKGVKPVIRSNITGTGQIIHI